MQKIKIELNENELKALKQIIRLSPADKDDIEHFLKKLQNND